jgi:hypothetical protein
MEHNTLFKLIYTFILGVVLALFLGVGVSAFYEPPKEPEYPIIASAYKESVTPTAESKSDIEKQQQFEKEMRAYQEVRQGYERNVSVILLILAIITIAIGLVFSRQIGFLSDGILLGGLFTLVHSLIRGFAAEDTKYLFAAASVAVVVILYLGYRRFGRDAKNTTKDRSDRDISRSRKK